MFDIILSGFSSLLLLATAFYLFVKNRSVANAAFSSFLIFLALLEITGRLLIQTLFFIDYRKAILFPESLLPMMLMFFAITYGRTDIRAALTPLKRVLLFATLIFPAIILSVPLRSFFFSPDIQNEKILFLGNVGYWYYLGILLCCIAPL